MLGGIVTRSQNGGYFSFYKRKFLFFSLVFAVAGIIWWLSAPDYKADEAVGLLGQEGAKLEIPVAVTDGGLILIDGHAAKKRVDLLPDADEVRLPIVDEPGRSYDLVEITLSLPKTVAYESEYEVLPIHGTGAGTATVIDARTISYRVVDVGSKATISIVAKLPKGTVKPSLKQTLVNNISGIDVNVWVGLGVVLPTATIVISILLVFYQRRKQRIDQPDREITALPMALPPAIVGVLVHQTVRPREIAATLVDLAVRRDIIILDRERGFAFGKHKFDQRLLGYEKVLLSKIFNKSISSNRAEIEKRINSHFYSRKISVVSAGMYILATRLGYFKTNPQSIHAKYKLFGILSFFVGLAGFALSLLFFKDPPFIAFFWLGMMVTSLLVITVASHIPIRTPLGQEVLTNWLAFKKFLSNPAPIPYTPDVWRTFEEYLPYAIVFDCEAAWARRFYDHNFTIPGWYTTDKDGLDLEDFCLSLFPIISYVSRSLIALREPGFE
ncbi:MAG: DUF2207 domain-containing protein [Patescibacteria group bacterium]